MRESRLKGEIDKPLTNPKKIKYILTTSCPFEP